MTELEKSLLESLNKIAEENEELAEKLENATADKTFWYEAYCSQQKELEAALETCKEESNENNK